MGKIVENQHAVIDGSIPQPVGIGHEQRVIGVSDASHTPEQQVRGARCLRSERCLSDYCAGSLTGHIIRGKA
jgi:hypothetical protein